MSALGPCVVTTGSSSYPWAVWAETLEIAKKKLSENNLRQLEEVINLTSQSAEDNMEAIVKGLHNLHVNEEKNKWSYPWCGKKIIVVDRLVKILKCVERYTKVVDIVVQSNPQVSALVWAGVWAILRVYT